MHVPSLKLTVCCSNKLQINTNNWNVFCSEILFFPWWPKDQEKLKILEKKSDRIPKTNWWNTKFEREPPKQVLGDSREKCWMAGCPSRPPFLTPSCGVTTPDWCICHLITPSPNNSSLSRAPLLSGRSLEHVQSSPSKLIPSPHFISSHYTRSRNYCYHHFYSLTSFRQENGKTFTFLA